LPQRENWKLPTKEIELTARGQPRFRGGGGSIIERVSALGRRKVTAWFFNSNRAGEFDLYVKGSNGTGSEALLLANGNRKFPAQWTRDGHFVVCRELNSRTRNEIWVLRMDGEKSNRGVPLVQFEFEEVFCQISPDGHWIAYTTEESGQREVYVRPLPSGEGRWRVSLAGGGQPRWRGDNKELFCWAMDGKIMSVEVKAGAGNKVFDPGAPRPLFEARLTPTNSNAIYEYDVAADGKRFLLNTLVGDLAQPLNAVVNWDAGLTK
jgi:hypothetical protein